MGAPDPREEGSEATTRPLTAEEAGRTWWALQPVARPDVPAGFTESANPIDAFIAAEYRSKGLTPVGQADKSALLRRVYLDLIGIPPTPAEQEAFFNDSSPGAHEKVVDHLLASKQHGVRYARRWLDVLRYADVDERMIAADGIYLWRDWVINCAQRRCAVRPVCAGAIDGLPLDGSHPNVGYGLSLEGRAAAGRSVRARPAGTRSRGSRRQSAGRTGAQRGRDGFQRRFWG